MTEVLDLSSLAKISDGYSAGRIEDSVKAVLSERRVQQVRPCTYMYGCVEWPVGNSLVQLRRRPLAASEFIPSLSKIEPIYAEEEGEFKVQTVTRRNHITCS